MSPKPLPAIILSPAVQALQVHSFCHLASQYLRAGRPWAIPVVDTSSCDLAEMIADYRKFLPTPSQIHVVNVLGTGTHEQASRIAKNRLNCPLDTLHGSASLTNLEVIQAAKPGWDMLFTSVFPHLFNLDGPVIKRQSLPAIDAWADIFQLGH